MPEIYVSGREQLTAALAAATGGETFVLGRGEYGDLLINGRQFAAPVTIRSADANDYARFDTLRVLSSTNVVISSVDIGHALQGGEPEWTQLSNVANSTNVTFDRVRIHGSLDRNPGNDGWGILVTDTRGFNLVNSDLTQLARAFVIERTSDIRIADNAIHGIRSDGGDFTAVDRVTIENNRYFDFRPNATDHPDAIQFWTTGQTRGSSDIVIRNNVILQGAGIGTQGIFIRDESGVLPHRNITIENNLVYSSDQFEGLIVDGVNGLRILGNTVVSPTTDGKRLWIRVDNARDAVIDHNVSDDLLIGAVSGLVQGTNLVFQRDWSQTSLIGNLNAGVAAQVGDFVIPGLGFQPGSHAPSPAPAPSPVPSPTPSPTPPPAPEPAPSPVPAPSPPPARSPISKTDVAFPHLYGTEDPDVLQGSSADQRLGAGMIDRLSSGDGADIFVLGDARDVLYDDGSQLRNGVRDDARLVEFQSEDKITLAGTASDYVFEATLASGTAGLGIFVDVNDNGPSDSRDELIALVPGVRTSPFDSFLYA